MKLFRISNVLLLCAASGLGGLLFWTSQQVQTKQDDLAALTQQSQAEQDSLDVLSAEWEYLNRPQRLEELAHTYLNVQSNDEKRVITDARAIPEPLPEQMAPEIVKAAVVTPAPAPAKPAPIISKNDSERFDTLLKSLSGGAE